MKLQEGQHIKLVVRDYHSKREEFQGRIERIYKNYILLDFKNYKQCIQIADLIDPFIYRLKVRVDKQWIDVTKEMVEAGVIS